MEINSLHSLQSILSHKPQRKLSCVIVTELETMPDKVFIKCKLWMPFFVTDML